MPRLWQQGGCRGGFHEKLPEEQSPCPAEPKPCSSKTDEPLVKAGPISSGGTASGIGDLRREVIAQEQIAAGEESDNM